MTKKHAKEMAHLLNTLPKSIRVGPWDVTIEIHEKAIPRTLTVDNAWGCYCPDELHIDLGRVGDIPNKHFFAGTVLHEIMHAMWSISNLKAEGQEEEVVQSLENMFVQVFRDNPEFKKWWSRAVS